MPKIDWTALLAGIREHLLERVRLREIKAQELAALLTWIKTNPNVPEGSWCKDFGSFKLAGAGRYPKTFLLSNQPCYGEKL